MFKKYGSNNDFGSCKLKAEISKVVKYISSKVILHGDLATKRGGGGPF